MESKKLINSKILFIVQGVLLLFLLISFNDKHQSKSLNNKKKDRMTVLSPRIPNSPKKIISELLDDSCFVLTTTFPLKDSYNYKSLEIFCNTNESETISLSEVINTEVLNDTCFTLNSIFPPDYTSFRKEPKKIYSEIFNSSKGAMNSVYSFQNNKNDIVVRYKGVLKYLDTCDIVIIFRAKLSKSCIIAYKHDGINTYFYSNLCKPDLCRIINLTNYKYFNYFNNYSISINSDNINLNVLNSNVIDESIFFNNIRISENKQ